ncbi:hypothetical protein [Fodinibius sp.]|uniref:hypothetical protein n=1 Tax=Fodinibius sp. TaxID=1872440 RepID=UPI002ACDB7E5|nr:hypothetical protein [Fodinibius sp.]MDZ7659277.1 hypothetical protein [Fodinibius sp.]
MDEEILENLNEELDNALDRGRQMVEEEELAKRVEELKLRAENLIRKHPVKSVAGGLFIGYIVGKLLSSED